jgi:BirA family biotin operon repressor/biotin-[acetyl-CoA-carboxylase] ligase
VAHFLHQSLQLGIMDHEQLRKRLPRSGLGDPCYFFPTIGSTNDEAKAMAEQDLPHGTLILADEQTRGRGRLDRRWVSKKGAGLWMSLLLRPSNPLESLGAFSVMGALAVVEYLKAHAAQAWIKWPNDVIVDGGKVCGVLVEAGWRGNAIDYIVLGMGVNVHPESVPDADLDFPATCIDHVLGKRVDREEMALELIDNLGGSYAQIGSSTLLEAWESNLAYRGEQVILQAGDQQLTGRLDGIAADGRLKLSVDTGETLWLHAGDLRLRPIDMHLD